MKKCKACGQEKPDSDYYKDKRTKDGLIANCKICHKAKCSSRRKRKKDEWEAKWEEDPILLETLKLCISCGESKPKKEFGVNYENGDGRHSYCSECCTQKVMSSYDKEKHRKYQKQWRKDNPDKVRENKRRWKTARRERDPIFRLKESLYSRLRLAIKEQGAKKHTNTMKLVGCTLDELRAHLESQFKESMTWENYGEWHIDHIQPCASFDLSDPEQQKACFHYTNLQPLWAKDNLIKSDKILNAKKEPQEARQ